MSIAGNTDALAVQDMQTCSSTVDPEPKSKRLRILDEYGHLTSSLFQTEFILNKAVGRDSEPAYDRSFTIDLLNRRMFDEI